MFQHFSFTQKNNASSRPSTLTTTDVEGNDTEALSSTTNHASSARTSTPDTETMIIGHKLSYANEAASEREVLTTRDVDTAANENEIDGENENAMKHVDDGDEGSLLSVEVDDLSGSILDNLPSTNNGNNNVNGSIDDDIGDDKVTTKTDPAFYFEPIVQAMQELQHEAKSSALVVQVNDYDFDADDEILQLAPSLQRRLGQPKNLSPRVDTFEVASIPQTLARPSNTLKDVPNTAELQRDVKHVIDGKIVWRLFFWFAVVSLWWVSKLEFVTKFDHAMTTSLSTNEHVHSSTNSEAASQSIPIPSPVVAVLQTEQAAEDITLLNVPTYVRISNSIEPTIAKFTTDDMINGGGKIDTSSSSMAVNRPMVSLSTVPQMWLPHQLIDFVAAVRYLPTFVHRIVSMIIYTSTIAVAGFVFILLLAKFAMLTWKKANLPEENSILGRIETAHSTKLFSGETIAQRKVVTVKSLCEFLQSTHFSRAGRRSRSPPSKEIKGAYNIDGYEQLSVDDLKCIGKFLGVTKLSKLQQKSNLINAIVTQYEISLQSLSVPDIKEILSVMKIGNIVTSSKKVLIKLAIEVGF